MYQRVRLRCTGINPNPYLARVHKIRWQMVVAPTDSGVQRWWGVGNVVRGATVECDVRRALNHHACVRACVTPATHTWFPMHRPDQSLQATSSLYRTKHEKYICRFHLHHRLGWLSRTPSRLCSAGLVPVHVQRPVQCLRGMVDCALLERR